MDEPFKQNCSNCANLDRSRKRQVGICYQYGCKSKHTYYFSEYNTGWIPCWIGADHLLADLRCGKEWMPIIGECYQITIDDLLGGENI